MRTNTVKKNTVRAEQPVPFDLTQLAEEAPEVEALIEDLPDPVEGEREEIKQNPRTLAEMTIYLLGDQISREQWTEKAAAYAAVIRREKAFMDQMKAEKKSLEERIRVRQANVDRMTEDFLKNMAMTGTKKFDTPSISVSTRTTTNVVVDDEELLKKQAPDLFRQEVVYKLDKKALNDDVKNGVVYDGVHSETKVSLTLK